MSGEANTTTAAVAPQCQFFVQRKKRLCRMTVKPGRQYCGEHQPQPQTEADQADKRIPCPNDPKHTCYASKLLKHLAICNARLTEQPPYIVQNINAPEAVNTCPRKPLGSYPKDALYNVIDKVNHLYSKHVEGHITPEPSQPVHRAVLPEFSEADRAESSRRHLRQVSALLWAAERAGLATPSTCYVELGAGKGQLSYYAAHAWCAESGSRVLAVDRAPLRHKRDNKLRSAPPTNHEHHVTDKDGNNSSLLSGGRTREVTRDCTDVRSTDQQDSPNGRDSESKSVSENDEVNTNMNGFKKRSDGGTKRLSDQGIRSGEVVNDSESEVAVRVRADLAHLALGAVPVVAECKSVVGLAKHLCGVATDYALRCIAAKGVVSKTKGLVLATCCHHRVERALYVASRQLQELGIDAEEFNVMLGIVSWATCGDGRSRERRLRDAPGTPGTQATGETQRIEETQTTETKRIRETQATETRGTGETQGGQEAGRRQEEREETGRRAKALLDWGRVLWLRERGFDARLCYYVPRDVSLENVAIVATKR